MSHSDLHALLINKIRDKYRTLRSFAEVIGMHPATLSAKLKGKYAWTFPEVTTICKVLGIRLADAPKYFPPR